MLAAGTAATGGRRSPVAGRPGHARVLIAALGPALTAVPLHGLRLVVGGLLLVFGCSGCARRSCGPADTRRCTTRTHLCRAGGRRTAAPRERRGGVADWYAFTLSFKGVLLEGLEVVFIALTFGTNDHNLPLAALAAGAAVVVSAAIGVAVRAPLARVPENSMKFVVGVMLTAFGTFWGAEGAGAHWPGNDAALPSVVAAVAVLALVLVAGASADGVHAGRVTSRTPAPARWPVNRLKQFGAFMVRLRCR